jgi:hypothetical protein
MNDNGIASQSQAHIDIQSKIDDFVGSFKIATLVYRCMVRKHRGRNARLMFYTFCIQLLFAQFLQ